jgi:capsular polysaccharide biosynthesis protein
MFVKDYRELIKSRSVTKEVIEELKIKDLTPKDLAAKITVNMKNETRVLDIRVRDLKPERAKQLAETVSKIFVKKSISLMNIDNVNIVDNAEIPKEPVGPKPLKNSLYAFIISLIITIGIAYLIEYLNDKIKSTEDVENHMGLTVIGIIPLLKVK